MVRKPPKRQQQCEAILSLRADRSTKVVGDILRCSKLATRAVSDPFLEQVYLCDQHAKEFSREENT